MSFPFGLELGTADLFLEDEEFNGNTALLAVETSKAARNGSLVSKDSFTHEFKGERHSRVLEERCKPDVISLPQMPAPDVNNI